MSVCTSVFLLVEFSDLKARFFVPVEGPLHRSFKTLRFECCGDDLSVSPHTNLEEFVIVLFDRDHGQSPSENRGVKTK